MDHIVNVDFLVVCGYYIKPMKTLFHGEHAKQGTEEQEAEKIGFRSSFKVKLGLILALVRKVVTYFDNSGELIRVLA